MNTCDTCECNIEKLCSIGGHDIDIYDLPEKCDNYSPPNIHDSVTEAVVDESRYLSLCKQIKESTLILAHEIDEEKLGEERIILAELKVARDLELERLYKQNETNKADR